MPSAVVLSLVLSVSAISASVLVALAIHFAELTACATVSTVASLPFSASATRTWPAFSVLLAAVTVSIVPVTAFTVPSVPTVIVLLSVLTLMPFEDTVMLLPSALTVMLPPVSLSRPLPNFTSYFTLTLPFTLPSAPLSFSTVTLVPLPSKKFTCSLGLMVSTSVLAFPATFQPLAFNWLTFTASLPSLPLATLVILVGLVPSAPVTFKLSPSLVIFGPLLPPI